MGATTGSRASSPTGRSRRCGANLERLAEERMVVQYDGRGVGMSQRDVTDFSFEARIRTSRPWSIAWARPLSMSLRPGNTGPIVITYTARHPELCPPARAWVRGRAEPRLQHDAEALGRHTADRGRLGAVHRNDTRLVDFGWTELGRADSRSEQGSGDGPKPSSRRGARGVTTTSGICSGGSLPHPGDSQQQRANKGCHCQRRRTSSLAYQTHALR